MTKSAVSVSDIINKQYREYSMYTIEDRALPSMIDGFKPSQRKALYCATKVARSLIKTASLTGETLKQGYHHGDASMNGAISLMTSDWNNNAPILQGEGNFGNRFNKAASAARYTKVKLSENFTRFFKDPELLVDHLDPEIPEPTFYLPLIPWVLVNGTSGVAIGFACEIQPRDPKVLVKACLKALDDKKLSDAELPPAYLMTRCKIAKDVTDRWYAEGTFDRKGSSDLVITELPPGLDRADFVSILDRLEDENKIADYEDACGGDSNGFKFIVKFRRGYMPKTDEEVVKMFKLRQILSENLTVLDEKGELRIFTGPSALVTDFVAFRLAKIKERYENYIKRDEHEMYSILTKLNFIQMVVSGELKFLGHTKADIIFKLVKLEGFSTEDAQMCLRIPMTSLCEDAVQELKTEAHRLKAAIATWKSTDPVEAYKADLNGLLKK